MGRDLAFLPNLHEGVCLCVRAEFWRKPAPDGSRSMWPVELDGRSWGCWEPKGGWGEECWKGEGEPCPALQFFHTNTFLNGLFLPCYLQTDFMDVLHFRVEHL